MLIREEITKERIDWLVKEARKGGEFPVLSHDEREENRRSFLETVKEKKPLWIFGYGSLIWNPAFHFVESKPARVFGYRRNFCLNLTIGRGSVEYPGLMLALDRGGSCNGLAFKIAAEKMESETEILWLREMISGAYQPKWINIHMDHGIEKGFTFVANRNHSRYQGKLGKVKTAKALKRGKGHLGSCIDYFNFTVEGLKGFGITDNYLDQLQKILKDY